MTPFPRSHRAAPLHLLALVLLCPACASTTAAPDVAVTESPTPPGGKLPTGWRERPAEEPCAAWVVMRRQVDLGALRLESLPKGQRRDAVLAALRSVAKGRREGIEKALSRDGAVESSEGLTIVNSLVVRSTRGSLARIAERGDVAYIVEERRSGRGVWGTDPFPGASPDEGEGWWLEAIGARRAWESGVTGEGVVIGVIDSGASAGHEQTAGGYRGGADAWFDPDGEEDRPVETHPRSHGTSIVSLAAGRGGKGRPRGVAPGATWVAALGFPEGRFDNLDLVLCTDWMLCRGRPDILIAAWEIPGSDCDSTFDRILSVFRASGTFVLFAAGNHGPGARTNRSPANSVRLYPGRAVAFSVGATIEGGGRLPEGSEGPNVCDPSEVFPRVCAPGAGLVGAHALAPDLYVPQRGTSFSVALAAGAVALILEKDPGLEVAEIETCLTATALDLGEPGPDNVYGYGLIRVDRALEWIEERGE